MLFQVDLSEGVVGSDLPHESDNNVEESLDNVHAPLSVMQDLHPSNCVRAEECYTSISLPDEYMVSKEAYIEKFATVNQENAESILPNKQTTTELHPRLSRITKEGYTNLSSPQMVSKKARIEKFDRANQGCAESTLPDKQFTNKELHPSNYARAKEGYTNLSLPHEHIVAKKAHIEKIDRVNQGCAKAILPNKQFTNQELHPSNCARTKEGSTKLSLPHEHMVAKKAHGPESHKAHVGNVNAAKQA